MKNTNFKEASKKLDEALTFIRTEINKEEYKDEDYDPRFDAMKYEIDILKIKRELSMWN